VRVTGVDINRLCSLQVWLLIIFCLIITRPVWAAGVAGSLASQSIAQITFDDERKPLDYPFSVFFDPVQEELYVVNGGNGRIIVYGPDYFPRWSIGKGRGVITPQAGIVLPDGRLFIVQAKNRNNPTSKITVLNGSFFPEQEIPLDGTREEKEFDPRNVAIGPDGLIYVAGNMYRGVLVFDEEGYFLRKLQPTDRLSALSRDYQPEQNVTEEGAADGADVAETDEYANIPEEFRPRKRLGSRISGNSGAMDVGPVKVNYVATDSQGQIYVISPETGKIYVYDAEERFLFAFGAKGGSPGQLSNPRGLAIDEDRGLIYVVDYMRHSVLAYNLAGKYLFEIGGRGFSPGWFNFPSSVAINSRGELIVADVFNKRVQVLSVDYDSYLYDLKNILKPDSEAEETKQNLQTEGDELKVEEGDLDGVPSVPDINSTDMDVEMEPGADEGEVIEEDDSGQQVEIEILQDTEIPAISK